MKITKKLLSLLLVAVMVMTLGIAAFAAGSITIDNVTTDHTYSAYKVLDVDFDASTPDKVVYSIAADSPWYATVSGATDVFALTEIETGVYSVELKSGATIDDIVAALGAGFTYTDGVWTAPSGFTAAASKKAAATDEGVITFSGLDYGYYFITSTLGAAVTIDTNNPEKTVIDKNEVPEWDNPEEEPEDPDAPVNLGKVIIDAEGNQVTENSVNYGESVNFDIAVKTTKCVGTEYVTYYYITDTIADGFTLDLTSDAFLPTVKVNDDITLVKDTDYKIEVTGNTFTIKILWATPVADTEGKVTGFTTDYKPGDIIHVSYSATLNADGEDVVIGGTGNVNTAKYTYNTLGVGEDDPDEDFPDPENSWSEPKTTKTYTYAVAIQKVDESGVALAGATFATTDFSALKESDGRYYYCKAGTTDAVQTFATDSNGVLVIKGLAEGDYTFTEASAPAGYNPITGDIVITAELDECTESTVTAYYDADGNLTSTETSDSKTYTVGSSTVPVCATVVQNKTGTVLPSTGGIGTTMFYILGCLMLVGATVLLITKKRMSVNN